MKTIKAAERNKRGSSKPIHIASEHSFIPPDFNSFLKNGDNKTKMISLIRKVMEDGRVRCLQILDCKEIYFSEKNECIRITHESVTEEQSMSSNQEEADTKVILHSKHAYERSPEKTVIVRSPSGDIDIIILMIAMFKDHPNNFFLDSGRGNNRKGFLLKEIVLNTEVKKSHRFSCIYWK